MEIWRWWGIQKQFKNFPSRTWAERLHVTTVTNSDITDKTSDGVAACPALWMMSFKESCITNSICVWESCGGGMMSGERRTLSAIGLSVPSSGVDGDIIGWSMRYERQSILAQQSAGQSTAYQDAKKIMPTSQRYAVLRLQCLRWNEAVVKRNWSYLDDIWQNLLLKVCPRQAHPLWDQVVSIARQNSMESIYAAQFRNK